MKELDLQNLPIKYYETYLVGTAKRDAQGIAVDASGAPTTDVTKMVPVYSRVGNPAAEVIAAIGRGKFYQATFIEKAEGDNVVRNGFEVGPVVGRGKTVIIFETRSRVIFNALAEKEAAGKITTIVPLALDTRAGRTTNFICTGKIEGFLMPGYHLTQACGFDHYLYRRNPLSHKIEPIVTPGWGNDGKWDANKKTTVNWVDVFLFADQILAAEAFIKAEMSIAKKYCPPNTGSSDHVATE